MIRISTIFIGICMVLVAASLGMVLYSIAGITVLESAIVALTALTFMVLYNAVSMRMRDRADAGGQLTSLSRGTADLAHQVAEFSRRLAAVEGKIVSANSTSQDRIHSVMGEISELGGLVKQLASSVASHEDLLASRPPVSGSAAGPSTTPPVYIPVAPPVAPSGNGKAKAPDVVAGAKSGDGAAAVGAAGQKTAAAAQASTAPSEQLIAAVRGAIADNRIDIHLQPMVTLPQRKVRFYEAMTRLRDDKDQVIQADDFIKAAEAAGLMGQIDHAVMLRCMQVLRRLMVRNKDVGVFCNVAAATLSDPDAFAQCIDFLDANRAVSTSFVLEFRQSTFRNLGPVESEHLAALAQRGYRFSIDHVADLRMEPRELADRGVRFIKVPASLLLDQRQTSSVDIHPADLSDLLGRFGIDLIAERIEVERAVVDLLDYDVRFGQGFLFAAPRPLRPETSSGNETASRSDKAAQDSKSSAPLFKNEPPKNDPPRTTGNAALARRATGPN